MRGSSFVEMVVDDTVLLILYRRYIYRATAAFMVHNIYAPVLLYEQVRYVCMYSHQSTFQTGKVAKPADGQLNRE